MTWRTLTLAAAVLLAACSGQPAKVAVDDLPSSPLSVEWRKQLGTGSGSVFSRLRAVVEDNRIYAADTSGAVTALELDSGSTIWSIQLDKQIGSAMTKVDDTLYVVTYDGVIHALSAEDGSSKWEAHLSSESVAPVGADSERVFVHTVDGRIAALDAADGKQLWSYETSMPVLTVRGTGTPMPVDGLVITGLANGKVIALDRELGIPRWEARLAMPEGRSELDRLVDVDGTVYLEDNLVYAASYHGKVAAIGLDGNTRWEEDGSSYTSPELALGNVYLTLDDGRIQAYDQATGNGIWTQVDLKDKALGPITASGNHLAVADSDGYLYLLNQQDGSLAARIWLRPRPLHINYPNQSEATRWREMRGRDFGIRNPIIATDKGLLVYTNDGEMLLLEIRSE
ncbi:outer membrane protein assembly factor BamB [Parathalassolituus penaei]|uniref:Outer membrane protein assembly factor BamB n=1 Tax=Parathalassolituus penaei TaxID=2997323 RepID=A0A9X3IUJ9_9GAMM|nr:outer membrane protein assembly factor BamB [Parathalassolituus penaei]MCY0967029.1 outer membrane protein assembly factor BamB [Parathalassolituus penaei]